MTKSKQVGVVKLIETTKSKFRKPGYVVQVESILNNLPANEVYRVTDIAGMANISISYLKSFSSMIDDANRTKISGISYYGNKKTIAKLKQELELA